MTQILKMALPTDNPAQLAAMTNNFWPSMVNEMRMNENKDFAYMLVEMNYPKCLDALLTRCPGFVMSAHLGGPGIRVSHFAYAISRGHIECVKVFLKHSKLRTDVNIGSSKNPNVELVVPIFAAAGMGRVEIVSLLIDHRPAIDLNERQPHPSLNRRTPLMNALFHDNVECAVLLLDADDRVDVNAIDADGKTALHHVCGTTKYLQAGIAIVLRLLEAGADPNIKSNEGHTAADMARTEEQEAIAGFLPRETGVRENPLLRFVKALKAMKIDDSAASTSESSVLKEKSCGKCQSTTVPVDVVLRPCDHLSLCSKCRDTVSKEKSFKCPQCESHVEEFSQI